MKYYNSISSLVKNVMHILVQYNEELEAKDWAGLSPRMVG